MLKLPVKGLDTHPMVRTERIKTLASGTQLVAVGLVVGSVIGAFLNPALPVAPGWRLGAFVFAAALELSAMRLLHYLATTPDKED